MAFWTDSAGQDPKRNYRFLVTIGNLPYGASWYAKKVNKPAFSIGEIKHAYLNHTFYYPGRVDWQPVSVTLVDPVNPDAVANTLAIIAGSGYRLPTSVATTPEETTTISKASSIASLGGVFIEQIDNEGQRIEQWSLNGAFLTEVSYSELSYDSDELSEITLKFRYDWADCVTAHNATVPGAPKNDFFKLGST